MSAGESRPPLPPDLIEAIAAMRQRAGLYIVTVPERPNEIIPMCVGDNGKLYSMKIDEEISWDGFRPCARIHGPYPPIIV